MVIHTPLLYVGSASNSAGPEFISLFGDELTKDFAEFRKLLRDYAEQSTITVSSTTAHDVTFDSLLHFRN
jgi:hypothetical protein